MALPFQIQFPVTSTKPKPTQPFLSVIPKPPRVSHHLFKTRIRQPLFTTTNTRKQNRFPILKAIEDGEEEKSREPTAAAESEGDTEKPIQPEAEVSGQGGEFSELGAEIKKAMAERKEKEGNDLLSGVAEEVREIEWPAFGKVLGTTGVVLGVIAGSSVVLLTVNFVLAELSDKVFAGRGVQDFFS